MDHLTEHIEIDRASLETLARRALDSNTAVISTWSVEPLSGGIGADLGGAAPHRVTGQAIDSGTVRPWSLVLKILRKPSSATEIYNHLDPAGMFYWKREALIYGSELLDGLPPGFAAPRCYDVDERGDAIWLWIEDLGPAFEREWSLARYALAARHLGQYNGLSVANGCSLPDQVWLCRDLLRWRQALAAPRWEHIVSTPLDLRVRRGWPGTIADQAYQTWVERENFLNMLDRLPQVMSHGDADRRNLFSRETEGVTETVAIDWGCAGPRAAGSDLVPLIVGSTMWARDRDPSDLPALDLACFAAHMDGLLSSGWTYGERQVRLGYTATAALQFCALAGALAFGFVSEEERPRIEAAVGMSFETMLDRHAAIQPFVLDLANEARSLSRVV